MRSFVRGWCGQGMTEGEQVRPSLAPNDTLSLAGAGVRFGFVGLCGVVVNTAVLALLYRGAHLPLFVSSLLAVESSIAGNYLLNNWWTFHGQQPSWRGFAKFNVACIGALVLTPIVVWLLTDAHLYLILANLVGIAAGAGLNFTLSALWVWPFRDTRRPPQRQEAHVCPPKYV